MEQSNKVFKSHETIATPNLVEVFFVLFSLTRTDNVLSLGYYYCKQHKQHNISNNNNTNNNNRHTLNSHSKGYSIIKVSRGWRLNLSFFSRFCCSFFPFFVGGTGGGDRFFFSHSFLLFFFLLFCWGGGCLLLQIKLFNLVVFLRTKEHISNQWR